ncbi:hypothetical protein QCA50_011281 [Cerrena zonata]|uniref:DUF6533 domain-containing protein n=1 Tax=Cerrena zonata TaxID=2478898 RepID=A0AAW0FV04_9APHY
MLLSNKAKSSLSLGRAFLLKASQSPLITLGGSPMLTLIGVEISTHGCSGSRSSMSQADIETRIAAFLALVATKVSEGSLLNQFVVAASALIYYDYILTLPTEIRCIWQRKFSAATLIYFTNRYGMLLYQTLMLVHTISFVSFTEAEADMSRCNGALRMCQSLSIMLGLATSAFLGLRLYAIWNNDLRVLAFIMCIGIVGPIINIGIIALPSPLVGCGEQQAVFEPQISLAYHQLTSFDSLTKFVPIYTTIFAAVALILTWIKTASIIRAFSTAQTRPRTNVVHLLIRDGTIYFISLLVLTIARFVNQNMFTDLPTVVDGIQSILISRFLLNLRNVHTRCTADNSICTYTSAIVGNLGAPLYAPTYTYDSDEEEVMLVSSDPLLAGLEDDVEEDYFDPDDMWVFDCNAAGPRDCV